MIAVRIAINIQRLGAPNPVPRPAPDRLRRALQDVMVELLAAAREADRRPPDSTCRGAGLWLGRAISATPPPAEVIDRTDAPNTDPALRAESLLTVRGEWVRLGALLTLIIVELDDLLSRPRCITWPEIGASTAGEAARAVHAAGLEDCSAAFDHRAAWGFQRDALGMIVGDFCLALQTCDEPLLRRTRTTVSRRLSRVAVAIWSLDHQLGGRPARRPPSAT